MPDNAASSRSHSQVRSRFALFTALKVAIFYLIVMKLAGYIFFFFWGKFSVVPLIDLLGKWHVDEYRAALASIYHLSIAPLNFALLTILAPLVGWWVYSRVEPGRRTLVSWVSAALYVAADAVWMYVTTTVDYGPVSLGLNYLIALLYVMLFMGLGVNFGKILRLRL